MVVTNPKTQEDQDNLSQRLRSLKIDREPGNSPGTGNRSPKLLLLALSALVAVLALGYVFLFSAPKPISRRLSASTPSRIRS